MSCKLHIPPTRRQWATEGELGSQPLGDGQLQAYLFQAIVLIHPGRLSDWGDHQSTVQAVPTSRDTPDTDHHAGVLPSTHTPCLGKPVSPTTSRVNQFNLATSPFPNLPAITSKPQLRKSHLAPLLPDFSAYKNISKSTEVRSHSFIRIIHAHNKHILGTSYMPGTRCIRQTGSMPSRGSNQVIQ